MTNPYHNVELLAPAGSPACLHAAVAAGADAVYLGCESFNARRGADNFTLEGLGQACEFAHLRGVRVYLTMNIAIMPDELERALEVMRQARARGVDAFIVQDLGLAHAARAAFPDVALHISTQMNTHNVDGVAAAAALGAARVTLARELSLEEVEAAAEAAHEEGMAIECFAHGALCVCYSGQCFMSSMVGGRSANRGMCAQACRLPYTLRDEDAGRELDGPGEHLLSPKDLCTIDMLGEMVAAGVDSLKIEGRMKSPEYVQAVVGVYRAVLDRASDAAEAALEAAHAAGGELDARELASAVRDANVCATDEEARRLSEAFSRGFTEGYLVGERGNSLMSYTRPNNRGVFAGRVLSARDGMVRLDAQLELHEGDAVEFWTNRGHFAVVLEDVYVDAAGATCFPAKGRIGKGDRVFRVRDATMAFIDNDFEPRLGVACHATLREGEPLVIEIAHDDVRVAFEGPIVEKARTKAVTPEEVCEHIDRVGNTPFFFEELSADVDAGVGIGFSALHKARTQALRQLKEALLKPWDRSPLGHDAVKAVMVGERADAGAAGADARRARTANATNATGADGGAPQVLVCALAANPACARAAKRAGADAVYAAALHYRRGEACVEGRISHAAEQAGYPSRCIPALPTVERAASSEAGNFDPWDMAKPDKPVLVENFGQLAHATGAGMLPEVGPHVPMTNAASLELARRLGARRVWLSPELSLRQIEELGRATGVPLGLFISGRQELMTCEHCLLMSQGPCNEQCRTCKRRERAHTLEDRKDYRFPVFTDACGRSHLYNAVAFDATHLACELIDAGVTAFMVDATLLSAEDTSRAVARALRARDAAMRDGRAPDKLEGCTTGHLFRDVQ